MRQAVSETASEPKTGQEPRGAGWFGDSEPLTVGSGEMQRQHDGAKLRSLRRWTAEHRSLPRRRSAEQSQRMSGKTGRIRKLRRRTCQSCVEKSERLSVRRKSCAKHASK